MKKVGEEKERRKEREGKRERDKVGNIVRKDRKKFGKNREVRKR